jgi:Fe-S cluster biogenesis protein NfuA
VLLRHSYDSSLGSPRNEWADDVVSRLGAVDQVLRSHGGGIELVELSSEGHARVRLTGACAGCHLKPLTVATIVRPVIEGAEGVKQVEVVGGRISHFAELRLQALESGAAQDRSASTRT